MILDTAIRIFVFLPTLLMAMLAGYLIKNIKYIIRTDTKITLEDIQLNQVIKRSKLLLENGHYLSKESYNMRKHYFNDKETGLFSKEKLMKSKKPDAVSIDELRTMVKNNVIDLLPMIAIAGLNNWMFSGFITTRVPFPVTLRFKSMLQRDIDMPQLDASWVSSISWYFMCIMGFRYSRTNVSGNEDSGLYLSEQVPMITSRDEIKKAWEDIEIHTHHWGLENADEICG